MSRPSKIHDPEGYKDAIRNEQLSCGAWGVAAVIIIAVVFPKIGAGIVVGAAVLFGIWLASKDGD